jgi:hypothetical protein
MPDYAVNPKEDEKKYAAVRMALISWSAKTAATSRGAAPGTRLAAGLVPVGEGWAWNQAVVVV